MLILENISLPRAKVVIEQHRVYDYDEKTGLFQYKKLDEVEAFNIVTDAGRVRIHTYIYGSAGQSQRTALGGGLNYIALSNDATAPAAGDTGLTGELSGNGLSRAQGTVTLPTGAGTATTVQRIFTYTNAASQGVQKTALFDAASGGTMAHEIQFPQRTLFQNDSLTVTYTITLA